MKRSATASANDETQICIDITGENDEKDPDGTPETVSDAQEDQRKSHSQYATITPFLNASEKWFPALNADLKCIWCGSGPVLCWFAVFSAGETQIWPGDLRVVAVAVFLGLLVVFSMVCPDCEAKGFHKFRTLLYRFSHSQDRALERDRPQQREKKWGWTSAIFST